MEAKKIIWPTVVILGILAIWEAFVRITDTPLFILPSPSKIFSSLISEKNEFLKHATVTLSETILGIVIAVLLALILAVLMDGFPTFKLAAYPILVVTQTIPVIILAPIFIIYLGFGLAPKVVTVVLMCFFPIVVSLTDGMARTDINQISLVKSFGATRLQMYTMVKFPFALPSFFSGLKVAATYSITGAVVGEWLSSDSGLGYYMIRAKNGFMMDKVFACILVIVILSLFMNGLVKIMSYFILPDRKYKKRRGEF